jgi:hypothetical protein
MRSNDGIDNDVEKMVEWELVGQTEVLKLKDRGSIPGRVNIFFSSVSLRATEPPIKFVRGSVSVG